MRTLIGTLALLTVLVACVPPSGGRLASTPTASPPQSTVGAGLTPSSGATTPPTQSPSRDGHVPPDEAAQLIRACPVSGDVHAYFRIPSGSDYRQHFPAMGMSPELEGVDGAFVVVYSGQVEIGPLTGIPGASVPAAHSDVLCVVLPSGGAPDVYVDVSRAGMNLPPGTTWGPP